MDRPPIVLTTELFAPLRVALLKLLRGLSLEEWAQPTVCAGWSVKDVAGHLLAGDVGVLSRLRDGYYPPGSQAPKTYDDLVKLINWLNDTWVTAMRRTSPTVLCDLLETTAPQIEAHFASIDPHAPGPPVDWAGEGPQPAWLDLAREFTERWHHQQQIRDAVGQPGMKEARYLRPVLDAFMRAVPRAYHGAGAKHGTEIQISIGGDAGRDWVLQNHNGKWELFLGVAAAPAAEVRLDQDDAWRLFTKGLRGDAVRGYLCAGIRLWPSVFWVRFRFWDDAVCYSSAR